MQIARAMLSRGRLIGIVILTMVTGALASCSMYHKKHEIGHDIRKDVDHVLQVDDVGTFWDPDDAQRALEDISKSAKATNTFVVVFVHGWHHNADSSDTNLEDFRKTMVELRKRLDEPIYAQSRKALTRTSEFRAIGIYLGWRGRSLPSIADYATFWGRKAAAERVGEGDFREFMLNLSRIYDERSNAETDLKARNDSADARAPAPLMGLVSIGHSFGGQVLLRATQPVFEANLIAAGARPRERNITEVRPDRPVQGFGDLVVLVNPAVEALQFDRIDRLNKSLKYTHLQPPLLFVISAASDDARRVWFPLGRMADAVFRANLRPQVAEMWGHALGSYDKQWTHTISIVGDPKKDWKFDPDDVYLKDECKLILEDLTASPRFHMGTANDGRKATSDGVNLDRLNQSDHPFSPFVVANVREPEIGALALIEGHTEVWKEVFRTFITNYAALTQGKKALIRRGGVEKCGQNTK